jgi:beta-N-acetylhexosaminidase
MIRAFVHLSWLLSHFSSLPAESSVLQVEKFLGELTVEQKVGQLMMIGFGGKEMGPEISKLLLELHIGSVALYNRNIVNNQQLAKLVSDIRYVMRDEIQPFIAIDQEGGNVVRVRTDVAVLPGAMALGATRDPILAFLAGQANAVDLGVLGLDMNLAPVLDVNRNPRNPVINIRAIGDHPWLVARLGVWFIQGQQQAGMATVAKHFPGHGTTTRDSHYSLPSVNVNSEQLRDTELLPFREAIARGLDAIMTAHVLVPAVDNTRTPASQSSKVITELLRDEMGFDGLVVTDDLEMRAIIETQKIGEAAIRAILAGADVVMVIWDSRKKKEVYQALLDAIRSGRIPLSRLDESVRRVLELKAKRGTLSAKGRKISDLTGVLPNRLHRRLMRTIAHRGITLVRNQNSQVPICSGKGVLVAGPQRVFLNEMRKLLPRVTVVPLKIVPSKKRRERDLARLAELAKRHRLVVVAVVNSYQAWLAQRLRHKTDKPMVVVSFGSPYYLRNFPAVDAYICTYSYLASAQRAAARALCGQASITGRLPVNLSRHYPRDHGLFLPTKACSASASR